MKLPFLIVLAILLATCKTLSKSAVKTVNAFDAKIGDSYNILSDTLLNSSCIDSFTAESIPSKIAKSGYEYNMRYEDVNRIVGGKASLSLNLDSVEVSGNVSFQNEFRKTDMTTSISFYRKISGGIYRLTADKSRIALNTRGKKALTEGRLREICGTHFVDSMEQSALLMGSIFVTFSSLQDKLDFDAKVTIDVASAVGASAKVKYFLEKSRSSSSIRMRMIQQGGDPVRASTAVSASIASCGNANRSACYDAFAALIKYADDFNGQLLDENGSENTASFILSNVEYISYGNLTEVGLVPDEKDLEEIKFIRDNMLDQLSIIESDFSSFDAVLKSGVFVSDRQKELVAANHEKLSSLVEGLSNKLALCYGGIVPLSICQKAHTEFVALIASNPYDLSALTSASLSMAMQCKKLMNWYEIKQAAAREPTDEARGATNSMAAIVMDDFELNDFLAVLGRSEFLGALKNKKINTNLAASTSSEITARDIDCAAVSTSALRVANLSLSDANFRSLHLIPLLTRLVTLDLSRNGVDNFQFLKGLTYIKSLKLNASRVRTLLGITSTTLRDLDLSDNRIDDSELAHLAGVPNLISLNLSGNNRLRSLTGLPSLPRLEVLNLKATLITAEQIQTFIDTRVNTSNSFLNLTKLYLSQLQCPGVHDEKIVCE